MRVDSLVVGAGFGGATIAERRARALSERVLVIDRRLHIGGNAFDEYDACGLLVHRYGPHIFHTNSAKVWEYLSRFTAWRPYEHKVLAEIDGSLVPVPFNLNSLYALFGPREAAALEALLISVYGQDSNVPILKLRQSDRQGLRALADFIYDKVFRGYTTKQWGFSPEQLAPSVTARVPVRVGRDDRYFQDTYQAMPEQGYTALFRRMLDHPNISVMLGVDYLEARQRIDARQVFFTGPIDAYFNYCYGRLPYRSLRFEHECFPDRQVFQAVGTVNYPNDHDYTRITEFKHLSGQVHPGTSIVREYPCNEGDPYYPIPREENERVYRRYEELARQESGVTFVGRLARYKYYNMDQVVASALRRCGVDA